MVKAFLRSIGKETPWIEDGPNPPDVVVRIDEGAVGMEVTTYHSDAGPGQQGGSRAMREHGELETFKRWFHWARIAHPDLDLIYGHLYFKRLKDGQWKGHRGLPPRKEQPLFVKELFGFVRQHKDKVRDAEVTFKDLGKACPLLRAYLEELVLEKAEFYSLDWDYVCKPAGARRTGMIREDELLSIVASKEDALKRVSQEVDRAWLFREVWLLVVAGTLTSPLMAGLSVELLDGFARLKEALMQLPCDAVFLYNYYMAQVVRWRRSDGWRELSPPKHGGSPVRP